MKEWMEVLPHANAGLNLAATVLLVAGFSAIRKGLVAIHRRLMLAAFACSVLFLVSYLIYHFEVGSVRFQGTGALRAIYLTVLVSHSLLAALVPFLALVTLWRGLRRRFEAHQRIARWTFPIWLYVSVTGVAIYWMLYRLDFS